jgi:diguanylate cyclase (GGDEF)-like protein
VARGPERHDRAASPIRAMRGWDIFTLVCIDVDGFKPVNDNFGHNRGDQVLRDIARIFRETVREDDIVARYGGDEFVVLLKGVGLPECDMMAGRLQAAVETYESGLVHNDLGALRLGISVGCGCYPEDGTDWETLFSVADTRMYRNKVERKRIRLTETVAAAAGDGCDSKSPVYVI